MKVIFLDFDGVIVTDRSISTLKHSGSTPFDRVAVVNLNTLIASTGAQVVISSSWRTDRSLNMKQVLDQAGVRCTIIGQTPVLGRRGYEIGCWLDAHPEGIEKFAILDDAIDDILCGRFAEQLVPTRMQTGFDHLALLRALNILGRNS